MPAVPSVLQEAASIDLVTEELIAKLSGFFSHAQIESPETLRSISAKLHARASSTDKKTRDSTLDALWVEKGEGLAVVLELLKGCRDHFTNCSLVGVLHECVSIKLGKANRGKGRRRSALNFIISNGGTTAILKILLSAFCGRNSSNVITNNARPAHSENMLNELIWLLAQVAQKDFKLSLRARVLHGLKPLHSLLRANHSNSKLLFPMMIIFKALVRSNRSVSTLTKDGIASTMEKVLAIAGSSPTPKLRVSLQVLSTLTKNKAFCHHVLKTSIIGWLLRCLDRAHKSEVKNRVKVFGHAVTCLLNLSSLRACRQLLSGQPPLQVLVNLCHTLPEGKAFDSLLARTCNLVHLVIGRVPLPVETKLGPNTFELPCIVDALNNPVLATDSGSDAGSDDEIDEGDDRDDDEDDTDGVEAAPELMKSTKRPVEELLRYFNFFREYGPLAGQIERQNVLDKTALCQKLLLYSTTNTMSQKDIERSLSEAASINSVGVDRNDSLTPHEKKLLMKKYNEGDYDKDLADIDDSVPHMKYFSLISGASSPRHAFTIIASRVKSVIPFVKTAHPELCGAGSADKYYPLQTMRKSLLREKTMLCLERSLDQTPSTNKVVFDLDALVEQQKLEISSVIRVLSNDDETRAGKNYNLGPSLEFESRFESGNLRKVIQTGLYEYDLILSPDINAKKRHQWFYFEVSNMVADQLYTFNIANCEKPNSQFNYGMKPVIYSVQEALLGRPGWVRAGTSVCYHRNGYQNTNSKNISKGSFFTATFSLEFLHPYDVVYIAYHYPYSFSRLLTDIWRLIRACPKDIIMRCEPLCTTLNGNEQPLLTITAMESSLNPIKDRTTIFLTSRVHPGESNASWVMRGTLGAIMANTMAGHRARRAYVFKVLPILNVEGVVNGCSRCGLTNDDLNRRWGDPHPVLHPEIYHAKGLIEYSVRVLNCPPVLFCDFHGHSRRKNVFLYGCSPHRSWRAMDGNLPPSDEHLKLPLLMARSSTAFSLRCCSYRVERGRENTARVAVWRQLGVVRSYTLEASFCGCDQGDYNGYHLDTRLLEGVGKHMVEAISELETTDILSTRGLDANCVNQDAENPEGGRVSDVSDSDSDEYDML